MYLRLVSISLFSSQVELESKKNYEYLIPFYEKLKIPKSWVGALQYLY